MSNTRKDGSMSAARAASTPKPKLVVKDRKNLYDFDKGSIGSIVIGAGLQERRSEVAGNYWEGRLPFNGGSLPFIVRGLADDFVPGNRNAFTGLLRIWTKTDNGGNNGTDRVTVGVTVQVVSDDGTKVFDLADGSEVRFAF